MRTMLLALAIGLAPAVALAQINTTGTLSPNTTVVAQTPTTTMTPTTPTTTTTTTPTASNGTMGTTAGTTTTTTAGTTAATAPAARDAAIVTCAAEFSTGGGRIVVSSVSTSAGVPTIAAGAPCAQALSDLFVVGFGVIDVLPVNQQVQYTLVR